MSEAPAEDDPYPRAIALLARREHAERELTHKLRERGFTAESVHACLLQLRSEGLQSDARYAQSYAYTRTLKGYGPLRIRAELGERGVAEELIEAALDAYSGQWSKQAEQARNKRFGRALPSDFKERARQARFLQYRGFSSDHFRWLFRARDE